MEVEPIHDDDPITRWRTSFQDTVVHRSLVSAPLLSMRLCLRLSSSFPWWCSSEFQKTSDELGFQELPVVRTLSCSAQEAKAGSTGAMSAGSRFGEEHSDHLVGGRMRPGLTCCILVAFLKAWS